MRIFATEKFLAVSGRNLHFFGNFVQISCKFRAKNTEFCTEKIKDFSDRNRTGKR